jgi:hypothetical protein
MLLFPPFVLVGAYGSVAMGFAFVLAPPDHRAQIAVAQLLVQWLFVVTLTMVALALNADEHRQVVGIKRRRAATVLLAASKSSAIWVALFWLGGIASGALAASSGSVVISLANAGIACTFVFLWNLWRAARSADGEEAGSDRPSARNWWWLSFAAWMVLAGFAAWVHLF